MKIAVSGASGFIGTRLCERLSEEGYRIVPLTRDLFGDSERLVSQLEGCVGVIHLAGAPINRRWSRRYKEELFRSRVDTTRQLVMAVRALDVPPRWWIGASAVGYYPDQGCYDESTQEHGTGFLAELCDAWEKQSEALPQQIRRVITRFGVVLSPGGGAFKQMILPFRLGWAAQIASGKQSFCWIDREDLIRALLFIIRHETIRGVVNLAAPEEISNADFTRQVARYFDARRKITLPGWIFKIMYGAGSVVVTSGQCARPQKLLNAGFRFDTPRLRDFLNRLCKRP